jgi:hypothetical protein
MKKFYETKAVQGFFKKAADPKHAEFFNNTLPTLETLIATGCYMFATEKQKDIPREQKNVLQWQNVLGCIGGMTLGSILNRKVTKVANELAPKIDKSILDVHKVEAGLKVGLPLVATALVMRLLVPVATAQLSSTIEEKRRAKKKLLNVTA